ncbi:MAG: branched-chain amino acid ABC transporter permease [Thiomonas sp. 14-64-326]|nr:MAG: branched-chain amino acid ABC transporter permease [Thiomonas sp. 14-64-326]
MNLVLIFNTFNGLITGAFYALLALGLALILGLNNTINFAQGAFMALAAYFAYTLEPSLGFWGDVIRTVWGANGVPLSIPESLGHPLSQTYFFLTGYRLFVVAVALVGTAVLFAVLRYTRLGIRIRAGNADLETVSALGVNIYLLRTANFVIGIVFAGVAGILAAGQLGLEPTMGDGLLMPAFVAIVVGGVGSLLGSLLGGLLIGVASGITTAYFPAASEAVIYLIMGLMLVVRPRGLMGQEGLFE